MSSTSRAQDRQDSDYYRTPDWAIEDFLLEFSRDSAFLTGDDITSHDLIVLDPCAGGDDHNAMAYPSALMRAPYLDVRTMHTVDIRANSKASVVGDYLKMDLLDMQPDIIITNPPFNLAIPIIEKALLDVRAAGLVIMLQRLNFFGSAERKAFFQANMPVATYVHSKRMRFLEGKNPKTGKPWPGDSIEYAHFVWQSGNKPKFTQLRVI